MLLNSLRAASIRRVPHRAIAMGQSERGHARKPHAFSRYSGTNFSRHFFSAQARSWGELAYWSGDSFSRMTTRSNSDGPEGSGLGSPCDHVGLPRLRIRD